MAASSLPSTGTCVSFIPNSDNLRRKWVWGRKGGQMIRRLAGSLEALAAVDMAEHNI